MRLQELIAKKRRGETHSAAELAAWLRGYLSGEVADYQMSAWLMAVCFQGMQEEELAVWTALMRDSGESLPRSTASASEYRIDKHSTGGVGDKTSLILVPWLISLARHSPELFSKRLKIPMVSGRGLGHTGGTLDKLESVPGFSARLSLDRASELLAAKGYFMMGQTDTFVPADRRLYALRDVTSTVDSLPLIVSSILSKKLAENLHGLVLDIKFGAGAFMPEVAAAQKLAQALVTTAERNGVQCRAVLTSMEEPLGHAVGNLLEVIECEAFLRGESREPGLQAVTRKLAEEMAGLAKSSTASRAAVLAALDEELESNRPLAVFYEMLEQQGANLRQYEVAKAALNAQPVVPVVASCDGYVHHVEVRAIAEFVREAGGGRLKYDDAIDPNVGVWLLHKRGAFVKKGALLAKVYAGARASLSGTETWFGLGAMPPLPTQWLRGDET